MWPRRSFPALRDGGCTPACWSAEVWRRAPCWEAELLPWSQFVCQSRCELGHFLELFYELFFFILELFFFSAVLSENTPPSRVATASQRAPLEPAARSTLK